MSNVKEALASSRGGNISLNFPELLPKNRVSNCRGSRAESYNFSVIKMSPARMPAARRQDVGAPKLEEPFLPDENAKFD